MMAAKNNLQNALLDAAKYLRQQNNIYVSSGPKMLSETKIEERNQEILYQISKLEELANSLPDPKEASSEYESILAQLRSRGKFLDNEMVIEIANALEAFNKTWPNVRP